MPPPKLKIACAGLGRMGKRHALHFLNRTPRAELVAASTPDVEEILWAKQHLEPFGVRLYKDYDAMLKQEGLQAVVIASVTTVHAEQAIKAIDANLHVLCEKPLSTSVEVVRFPLVSFQLVFTFIIKTFSPPQDNHPIPLLIPQSHSAKTRN